MLEFRHLNFYLLRSPLFSLDSTSEFLNLQESDEQESYLRSLYSTSKMQDALFLSSPELFRQVQKWLSTDIPLSDKLLKTLYKYTIRLGTRSTPYGLFAGISIGKILKSDKLLFLKRTKQDKVRYRLDMQYFSQLVQHISQDPAIRPLLKYSTNRTLVQQGGFYKFLQQQYNLNGNSSHYLRKIQATPVLDFVLEELKGERSYRNLEELILDKGAHSQQAKHFVNTLIENGILDSELSIQITADDFYETFLSKLKSIDLLKKYLPTFEQIGGSLKLGHSLIDVHAEIEKLTKKVFPDITSKNLIQGDLLLGVENNTIPEKDINLIIKQLKNLLPLSIRSSNKDLEHFKNVFRHRYENRMVPLLKALDPDTGIGYGNHPDYIQSDSIISDIKSSNQNHTIPNSKKVEELVFYQYVRSSNQFSPREVVLDEKDIASLGDKDTEQHIPSTFYAMGNLLHDGNPDSELMFCLHACGGTSAANLFTRFWDLDEEIRRNILDIGRFEQEAFNNAIVAEIVHLPEARTGNILQRPNMRKAEIALMAKCHQGTTKLDVDDLHIFVSGERLVLWSKELNCQIIPRLTSAHNFKTGMIIYRFLADLQNQDGHFNLKINWGNLEKSPFLPRIRYKNIIVSRAQWYIPKLQYRSLDQHLITPVLQNIQQTYCLPEMVLLSEGDNELLIDLSNPISRKVLFDKLCKQNVVLHEYIFSEFASPVKDGMYSYGNEIILPIATNKRYNEYFTPPVMAPNIQREFPLGSEWIYAKIYCGSNSAESLLKETVPQIIDILKEMSLVEKWFFIRYVDPEPHIRLRVKAKQKENFSDIVSAISNALSDLLKTQQINNLQFDTYIREIERYTPENMELSEELFHLDSQEVISIIGDHPNIADRWLPAIRGIVDYMNAAELDLTGKLQFVEKMRGMFFSEFGNDKQNDKILNLQYRKHRHKIENALSSDKTPTTKKAGTINSIIINLSNMYKDEEQVVSKKQTLIASYIHMFINRLFENNQRKYEYALYHMLSNHYRALVARKNVLQSSVQGL